MRGVWRDVFGGHRWRSERGICAVYWTEAVEVFIICQGLLVFIDNKIRNSKSRDGSQLHLQIALIPCLNSCVMPQVVNSRTHESSLIGTSGWRIRMEPRIMGSSALRNRGSSVQ